MYVDRFEIALKNNELITYTDRNGFGLVVPGDVDLLSSEYRITVKKTGTVKK